MPEDDGRINGVNLGGWLVLERWMTPGLFRASGEEDEIWLHRSTDPAELERLLRRHRASRMRRIPRQCVRLGGEGRA